MVLSLDKCKKANEKKNQWKKMDTGSNWDLLSALEHEANNATVSGLIPVLGH